MRVIENIMQRFGYVRTPEKPRRVRTFGAANIDRLFSSWTTMPYSADSEMRTSLKALRARSRDMVNNNDYAKKFVRMVETNVVGKNGIVMQSQVVNDKNEADELARKKIEEGWANWCRRGNCDVTGKYSFRDIQKLVIASVARDGEVLVRKIRGYDNDFGFALQLIEADHLDENYNDTLKNGNHVKMGVEYNAWNRPVAYHIYPNHPGDVTFGHTYAERVRIPAGEIAHIFMDQRISQSRGLPWMHAALTRLQMLGAYEEAELIAARIGAAKMGFFTSDTGEKFEGDDTEDGKPIMEVAPGEFDFLPKGYDFKMFDPDHPSTAFQPFVKALLRGIASGLNVSYHYLANDLDAANYSSLRGGEIDVRDAWRDIQCFLIEHFLVEINEEWLRMALLTGAVKLPMSKYDKFKVCKWQPRGWQWVDPEKDINSRKIAIEAGLETRQDVAAEQGKDLEDIFRQLAREKQLAAKYGINISEQAANVSTGN